jgi:hypothetical protein
MFPVFTGQLDRLPMRRMGEGSLGSPLDRPTSGRHFPTSALPDALMIEGSMPDVQGWADHQLTRAESAAMNAGWARTAVGMSFLGGVILSGAAEFLTPENLLSKGVPGGKAVTKTLGNLAEWTFRHLDEAADTARAIGSGAKAAEKGIKGAAGTAVGAAGESSEDAVQRVINETLTGSGQFNSKNTITATEALDAGIRFLGDGYSEIGKAGSGVFRGGKGRQFRIDNNSLQGNHPPRVPHVHFEIYDPPNAPKPKVNNHVPFTE